jgi:hypothetical protein
VVGNALDRVASVDEPVDVFVERYPVVVGVHHVIGRAPVEEPITNRAMDFGANNPARQTSSPLPTGMGGRLHQTRD